MWKVWDKTLHHVHCANCKQKFPKNLFCNWNPCIFFENWMSHLNWLNSVFSTQNLNSANYSLYFTCWRQQCLTCRMRQLLRNQNLGIFLKRGSVINDNHVIFSFNFAGNYFNNHFCSRVRYTFVGSRLSQCFCWIKRKAMVCLETLFHHRYDPLFYWGIPRGTAYKWRDTSNSNTRDINKTVPFWCLFFKENTQRLLYCSFSDTRRTWL